MEVGLERHLDTGASEGEAPDLDVPSNTRKRSDAFVKELNRQATREELEEKGVSGYLTDQLVTAVYNGRLRPGDRLPGIRSIARALGVSKRRVEAAVSELNAAGVTDARSRSGTYVAGFCKTPQLPPNETVRWLNEVLAEACHHEIRISFLPELITRWTAAKHLRCVCIDSTEDGIASLSAEVRRTLDLEPFEVTYSDIDVSKPASVLPAALQDADFWVTSPWHLVQLRPLATRLGIPLGGAAIHPRIAGSIQRRLQASDLVLVTVDPQHGKRLRRLFEHQGSGRFDVVLATDADRIACIPRSEPILITGAAKEAVGSLDFRLVAPISPAYDEAFSRFLASTVLRFNVERGPTRAG